MTKEDSVEKCRQVTVAVKKAFLDNAVSAFNSSKIPQDDNSFSEIHFWYPGKAISGQVTIDFSSASRAQIKIVSKNVDGDTKRILFSSDEQFSLRKFEEGLNTSLSQIAEKKINRVLKI